MVVAWETLRPTLSSRPAISLPRLSTAENAAAASIAAIPAAAFWTLTTPVATLARARSPALATALLMASLRWLVAFWALQFAQKLRRQASQLVPERRAAVEGSRWFEPPSGSAAGVALHYLLARCDPRSAPAPSEQASPLLVHFNHGFGANSWTWDPLHSALQPRLAAYERAPSP